jgi:membrane protease YdiL (CAAX protease family)
LDNYKLETNELKGGADYWLAAAAASLPISFVFTQFYIIHSTAVLAALGVSELLLTINQVFAPQFFMLIGVVGIAVMLGNVAEFKRICAFSNWRGRYISIAMGLEVLLFIPFGLISWLSLEVITALEPFAPKSIRLALDMAKALQKMLMESDWSVFLIIAFAAVVVAPIVEEIVFRAVLFNFLSRRLGVVAGLLTTSLIFSLFHLNAISFFVLFFLAVILQLLYIKTKSIYSCMVFHCVHNAVAILIMTTMRIMR